MAQVLKSDVLPDFLAQAGRHKWEWSVHDCTILLADWIACVHGVDPAGPYRGAYHDAASCARLLRSRGGLRKHIGRCAAPLGIVETTEPQRGDIGIVRVRSIKRRRVVLRSVGAICVDRNRWAVMTLDTGLLIARGLPVIAAWRV